MILRAGCYERVSTDEQAKFGFSIAAQKSLLEEHCEKNNIKIVDHYMDDGVSAGKPLHKRPAMMRLIDDVKDGKIDVILFTRLDRWYRSTKYYYQVQDILDKNNVPWKAIQEDYETTTSEGKFKVNIMLAVSEAERERGSDRTRTVLANKIKNKEAIVNQQNMFYGYTKEKDENGIYRLVKDPALKEAVQYFWDVAIKYQNVHKAGIETCLRFDIVRDKDLWYRMAKKEVYTGTHKGVADYCEPYVSHEDWERLQSRPKIKATQRNRIYLFTGMMKCPVCGRPMVSAYSGRKLKNGGTSETPQYRCNNRFGTCNYRKTVSEKKTEAYLLESLEPLIGREIAKVEIEKAKAKKKPKKNSVKLREQLRRVNVSFIAGNMTDEEYLADTKMLNEQIKKAEEEEKDDVSERDVEHLKELLSTDFRSIYEMLDKEEKRRFWRTLIKEIHLTEDAKVKHVDFF